MSLSALMRRWLTVSRGRRRKPKKNTDADFVRLGLTRLEDRVVLDGAGVVADLNPGPSSSSPTQLTPFNGGIYFAAEGTNSSGQSVGRELFRLNADGSVTLVADINPGTAGSSPGEFTVFQPNNGAERLLFAATGPQGRELYQLDTSGNVTLLFDVNPGVASSDPAMLAQFSGKLYFTAVTPAAGREAYVLNNGGNVSLIADLNPGAASSNPSAFYAFAGNLYFSADVPSGRMLFREAPSGTSDPVPVDLGTGVSDPRDFVTFNDRLYFSALDATDGRELFAMSVSNSSKETVAKVANLDGTSASSSPGNFFVFGQNLYFAATDQSGREFYRLNTSGTIAKLDIAPGSASSSPSGFVAFQGDMYFAATVGGTPRLWRLDTSTSGFAAVSVLPTGVVMPQDAVFYALGDELYFAADDPTGRELYVMTTARVVSLAADINTGPASSNPAEVILFSNKVYFVATEANVGRELFVLHRDPSSIRLDNGKLVFTDDAGDKNNRLDISSTGTQLVIVDQNGHTISILNTITGATGAGTNQVVIPLASLTGITALDIFTRGGNDSVTFDLSANANAILGQFVTSTYDGGTNTAIGDKLRFVGDGVTSSVYTPDATTTGSGVVVVSTPTQTLTFSFLALEPVDFTGMAEAKLVTPATLTGADILTIAPGFDSLDGLLATLVVSGNVGGTAIESGYFFGNQSVLIATGSGVDGTDSINVVGAANAHGNASLAIDTGSLGADTVLVGGNVALTGQMRVVTNLLNVQATVSLGSSANITTRSDTNFSAAGRLFSSQVTITAGGAIALADGSLISGAGAIGLFANGDITLGRLFTTNSTASAIAVTSLTGSIVDGDASGGAHILAEGLGAVATFTAAQGVGSAANPLVLEVRHLVVTSGGDQYLSELDDLSSLSLNAGSANIQLTAGGQIQDADANVDIVASQLVLSAASAGTAVQPLQTRLLTLVATVSGGDLHLAESDGLTVVSAAAPAGNINLRSLTGNLTIQSLQAQGLVTLVANTGAILSGAAGANVTAANLELSAPAGVGTLASPLATQVQRLEASGGTGGVFLTNAGDVQVGGISPTLLGLTGLSASSADIQLNVVGSLTAVESIATSGAGQVLLTASRSIHLSGTSITTTAGSIELLANAGAVPTAGSFTGITLENFAITSQTGNITLRGVAGTSGYGLLLIGSEVGRTGSGDVFLAGTGAGGVADIAWDTLTLAKSGGTFTFQDTVLGNQLNVRAGPYQVRFLDGGRIEQAVSFQSTGGIVLGNEDGDTLTFAGGLTNAASPTTIQGTVATAGHDILLAQTTLVSSVKLLTAGGNVTASQVFGAGVPLKIDAAAGNVTLANSQNVIGDLTVTAAKLTLVENDDITQGGAWTTTGPTIIHSGMHNIVLNNPTNVLGPLELIGANISVVAAVATELTSVAWIGNLAVHSAQSLLVTGLISGSGSAALSATGDLSFAPTGRFSALGGADLTLTAGGNIVLAAGSLVNAGGGTIGLTAGGDIALSQLVTTNNTDQAVRVTSLMGQITRSGGGPNITAEGPGVVVTLQAALGAGTPASPVQTRISQLAATVGSGGLFLSNAGSLNLVGETTAGVHGVQSTGGDIVIAAGGSLTASGPVLTTGAGQIVLDAVGDVTILDQIESAGGNITLRATRHILAQPTAQMSTATGTILLLADWDKSGGGTIRYAGNIDVGAGKVIFNFPDADGLLSGVIRGAGGLVKQGLGTLTIATTSRNVYTGTTDLLAGTLVIDGAIGAAGAAQTLTLAGGTTLSGSGDVNAPIFATATNAKIVSSGNLQLGDASAAGFRFVGTLQVGAGHQVTLRDADLAELGLLTMISSGGRLIAANGVEIGSGEKLAGSGTVSGNIIVRAGGQVSPGASPGMVSTDTGDLVLQTGAVYVAEVNGTQPGASYDQINVKGTVSVGGSVLMLVGGQFQPAVGTVFTLIANDPPGGQSDAVDGRFVSATGQTLGEGATVRFGGIEATLSYAGGPFGNSVTLTVTDQLKIVRTNTNTDSGPIATGLFGVVRTAERQLLLQRPLAAAQIFLTNGTPAAAANSHTLDVQPAATDFRSAQRLRVFFRVVNEGTGAEEKKDHDLDPDAALGDALGIFKRLSFPDGRYRLYLQEPGKRERLIVEVNIVDGKIVPQNFRETESEGTPQLPPPQAPPAAPPEAPPAAVAPAASPDRAVVLPVQEVTVASSVVTALVTADPDGIPTVTAESNRAAADNRGLAAATMLGGGLAATVAAASWHDRVPAVLARSGPLPRGRFSRFLRKVAAGQKSDPSPRPNP